MESNKLTIGVLGIVVSIILVGSILVPFINDSKDNMKTVYNNGEGGYIQDGMDNYEFRTNPSYKFYEINGEFVNVSSWGSGPTVLFTDTCRIKLAGHSVSMYDANTTRSWSYGATEHLQVYSYDAETKTLTCIAYNGLTEDTGILETRAYVVNQIVYRIPGGDYTEISTSTQTDYYVTSVDQIIAGGAYTSGTLTTEYFSQGVTTFVGISDYSGSAVATTEAVEGYKGLLKCTDYVVTITDGSSSESFTPYSVFVPKAVKVYSTEISSIDPLLGAIPLIVIVSILLGAMILIRGRNA